MDGACIRQPHHIIGKSQGPRDLMSVLRYNLCTPEVDFHVHWTLINKKIIDLEC